MATQTFTLTQRNFQEVVIGNDVMLVDFWASWCGPCWQFAPIFEAAAQRHPEVVFGKVDTEAQHMLAKAAQIRSIPTIQAFRRGELVFSQAGGLPPEALDQLIAQVQQLDLDKARELAQEQQAPNSTRDPMTSANAPRAGAAPAARPESMITPAR